MFPIRRFLLRELAASFGAVALLLLLLAGTGAFLPDANLLRVAFLAAALALFMTFCVWRIRVLARKFGDPLEALARSVSVLGEGRVPDPVPSDLEEIRSLGVSANQVVHPNSGKLKSPNTSFPGDSGEHS